MIRYLDILIDFILIKNVCNWTKRKARRTQMLKHFHLLSRLSAFSLCPPRVFSLKRAGAKRKKSDPKNLLCCCHWCGSVLHLSPNNDQRGIPEPDLNTILLPGIPKMTRISNLMNTYCTKVNYFPYGGFWREFWPRSFLFLDDDEEVNGITEWNE